MKILLFFLVLFNFAFSKARAREHITYLDFALMGKEQRREVIKMVQNFYTTTEDYQNYVEIDQKLKNNKTKKRTTFMQHIYNQFVAYAGTTRYDENERHTCFYGGWISQYYVNKSNTQKTGRRYPVCANPINVLVSQSKCPHL